MTSGFKAKKNLTERAVSKLTYQGSNNSRHVLWDKLIPGFGCRVYPNGKKSFVLSYRVKGRKRLETIGAASVLSLTQARNIARKKLVEVIEGEDPLTNKAKARNIPTLREFCVTYMEQHSIPHKKTWKKDSQQIDNIIAPRFGGLKLDAISNEDIRKFHREQSKETPVQANRVVELISVIFQKAIDWGYLEGNNPAKGVKHNKEKRRDRFVKGSEMPALAKAIDKEASERVYHGKIIWLYLLTGCRKNELINATWVNVDWDSSVLRIPETKNGRTGYIQLSGAAVRLLNELPRLKENPYIFPSTKRAGAPISGSAVDRAWRRIRKKAGLTDVRLHDLRRTTASWLAKDFKNQKLIAAALNHSNTSATERYVHYEEQEVRNVLEVYAQKLFAASGITEPGDVVELPVAEVA